MALTSSYSFSSKGAESNQSKVTCFDLIMQTRLLVRRKEVRQNSLKSSACAHWMDSSTQQTFCLWCIYIVHLFSMVFK